MGDDFMDKPPTFAINGEEEFRRYNDEQAAEVAFSEHRFDALNSLDYGSTGSRPYDYSSSSPSAGKLFVGGVAWETTEDSFSSYFCKYGELVDSILMVDKHSGRPRGFGFVTFADPAVASRVLEEEHVIDGRVVEVKRTVPRDAMQVKAESRTKKIFIGGLPPSLTDDELKHYFSYYGNIVEFQIMIDHKTGRSRGFGFVTFDSENAVERILSDGQMHELGGKQVEIKKAEPKRSQGDYANDGRRHQGSNSSNSYASLDVSAAYGSGYGVKVGQENGGRYNGYGMYVNYGGASAGFSAGYGAYGFGFGGAMYNGATYGSMGYGTDFFTGGNAFTGYNEGEGHGGGADGRGYGGSGSGYGGGKGHGNIGSASGRYNPYRK